MEAQEWLAAAAAYALGSLLPAELLVRRKLGVSMHHLGENPGGAGTWRTLGPAAGMAVVLFDLAKGAAAAWLARRVAATPEGFVLICTAPVAGHNWPPYLRFRGGRGLGPAAGALLVVAWQPFLVAFALGALLALRTRWVPTVGIVALPLYALLMWWWQYPPRELAAALAVGLTVGVRQLPWLWSRLQERRSGQPAGAG